MDGLKRNIKIILLGIIILQGFSKGNIILKGYIQMTSNENNKFYRILYLEELPKGK
ncbi:hypothetical protein [Cetobacterium sp. SF1]|uniref:hypothetical protein n=1 Tax=unclassified Cetobacterium TaxID=2630983 RepID=UPI003CF1DB04